MRIGCLGAARITPPAIVHPARVRRGAVLQSVAARDEARAQAFAVAHGFRRHDRDYAALVAAPDIDLVYNALPINLHAEWTIRALRTGKHVLCEKPFAMNAREAHEVLAAARDTGKRVIEAFHYRYHPRFLQTLAWIDAGEIGQVTAIDGVFNVPIPDNGGTEIRHLPETGGGAFMDLGCYPVSWTLGVLRQLPSHVEARAVLTPRGVDERMEAVLTFPGSVRATLSASMAVDAAPASVLNITGTAGAIAYVHPLLPRDGGSLTLTTAAGTRSPRVSRISTYTWQLEAVLDALEAGAPLPTEGDAIIMQQEVLDAVYAAAGLGHLRAHG